MRLWTDVSLDAKSVRAEKDIPRRMVSLHVSKLGGGLPAHVTMTFAEWDIFAKGIQAEHERLKAELEQVEKEN